MASISAKKDNSLLRRVSFLKNKTINLARERPLVTLLGLLLLLYSFVVFTSPREEKIVLVQSKNLGFQTLGEVATYLRANDWRLVRPSPADETWERQDSDACGLYLDQAYQVLVTAKQEDIKADAVNIITLCTTDRPKHRAKLTTVEKGVPDAIVSLLSPSTLYASKAVAAECIWISSFSSKPNHDAFVKAGAVESLSRVLTDHKCNTLPTREQTTQCYFAQMWAGAALQNLMAAYCDMGSGRCRWEWTDKSTNNRHEVAIHKSSKVIFNPESVRLSLIQNTKLLEVLKKIICDNVKELDKAPKERSWPSLAQTTDTDITPSVVAWGAIGAIRNMALSPEFYQHLPPGLQTCLCAHAIRSPDWLENSKAEDAIYRFGLDQNEVCEPLYDPTKCKNYKDWKDDEGSNCKKYEAKRTWCAKYRDYVPEQWGGDKPYVTAGEACCACGGGKEVKD